MGIYKTLISYLLLFTFPLTAWCWGDYGHKVVGEIALMNLNEADREEVTRLTSIYRAPDNTRYTDFATALTFPDLARRMARSKQKETSRAWQHFSKFHRWHFLNVPRHSQHIKNEHCTNNCVLNAIDWHLKKTQNTALNEKLRAQALFFLGHWIGDIHQPLHVAFADDRGGYDIKPIYGGYYTSYNLHSVWDSGIIKKAKGQKTVFTYAKQLNNQISDSDRANWIKDKPITWAQESYDIATSAKAGYCEWHASQKANTCIKQGRSRSLGPHYQNNFQTTVETRLQQAGIRLAEYIRRSLHPNH